MRYLKPHQKPKKLKHLLRKKNKLANMRHDVVIGTCLRTEILSLDNPTTATILYPMTSQDILHVNNGKANT